MQTDQSDDPFIESLARDFKAQYDYLNHTVDPHWRHASLAVQNDCVETVVKHIVMQRTELAVRNGSLLPSEAAPTALRMRTELLAKFGHPRHQVDPL